MIIALSHNFQFLGYTLNSLMVIYSKLALAYFILLVCLT